MHPDLVMVAREALKYTPIDFMVIEGLRSIERQRHLVAIGASKTLKSRHLTGHAIDVVVMDDGEISWSWPLYRKIAVAFQKASIDLDVPIIWGGNWKTFSDGPHFELNKNAYPG